MDMRVVLIGVVALLVAAASPTRAQDAQTYLYDANGRLIAATTARTGADGSMSSYALDDADNRTARAASAVSPPPAGAVLAWPYTLLPSQYVTSANGQYRFGLETGGALNVTGPSGQCWTSGTGQGRSMYARVGSDGKLSVYDTSYTPIWTTPAAASAGATLTIQNDGVAVLKSTGGTTLWSTPSC